MVVSCARPPVSRSSSAGTTKTWAVGSFTASATPWRSSITPRGAGSLVQRVIWDTAKLPRAAL